MTRGRPRVVVGGLGPAGPELITAEVGERIIRTPRIRLRTGVHPAAEFISAPSYDSVYEEADTFEEVYRRIVDSLVSEALEHGEVLYLVPGSPSVAERTVELLRERLGAGNDWGVPDGGAPVPGEVDLEILPAVSFTDLVWNRLGVDPMAVGARLVDAHGFGATVGTGSGPLLVTQCSSRQVLSDVKLSSEGLLRPPGVGGASAEAEVVILHHLGLGDEEVVTVPWSELDRTVEADHLTSLWIPQMPPTTASAMADFAELVARLRRECPWDRSQTHHSLTRHLIEETYELVEAIDALPGTAGAEAGTGEGDPGGRGLHPEGAVITDVPPERIDHLAEELGDVLLQVFLHSTIAEEEGWFDLTEVVLGIRDKLIYRHPHVFGEVRVDGAGEVLSNWEQLKTVEKDRSGVMDGLPALPALALATKMASKARRAGFRWSDVESAWAKVGEELAELREAAGEADRTEELGDVLLATVVLAGHLEVDPDTALRRALAKFRRRFEIMELELAGTGSGFEQLDPAELLALWDRARSSGDQDPAGVSRRRCTP